MQNPSRDSVRDQKELLFQIFAYMRSFQNWIVSEVSWFQSIIYYTVCCILSALFSASKKTANARIALFATQSLNVILERMLVQYHNNNLEDTDKVQLVEAIWMVRKGTLLVCMANLFYTWYTYKDEQSESFKVLRRIEHRLESLHDIDCVSKAIPAVRKYINSVPNLKI